MSLERAQAPTAGARVTGKLELVFRKRLGMTYLAEQYLEAPLKVVRPFSLEDGRALLQIVNVSPGIMGGDAYRIEITVAAGAKVVVVNQSAGKVHRMPPGTSATQRISLQVEDDAELEYYPGLTIPFPEADFCQLTRVHLAPEARFGMLEAWAMGRVSRGEYLAFRRLSSRTLVERAGEPLYADALELEPERLNLAGWGLLEGHRYLAAGCWWWRDTAEDQFPHTAKPTPYGQPVLIRCSLPSGGDYLRALSSDGLELAGLLQSSVNDWRHNQGMPELMLRRYCSYS